MENRNLINRLLSGKPYFGSDLASMQGVPRRHLWFYSVIKKVLESNEGEIKKIKILEIGSYSGFSTCSWCEVATELKIDFSITCVDPWEPYFLDSNLKNDKSVYGVMNEALQSNFAYELFVYNLTKKGFIDKVIIKKSDSKSLLKKLPEKSFDLIFIDGSHLYEDVLSDIYYSKKLVKPLGIICGDDLEIQAANLKSEDLQFLVDAGLDTFIPMDNLEKKLSYFFYKNSSYLYYLLAKRLASTIPYGFHPGVTKAVFEQFGSVESCDGFWVAPSKALYNFDSNLLFLPTTVFDSLSSDNKMGKIEKLINNYKIINVFDLLFYCVDKEIEINQITVEILNKLVQNNHANLFLTIEKALEFCKRL
jgi:hypothetical protein